jgi:hypothetical protein
VHELNSIGSIATLSLVSGRLEVRGRCIRHDCPRDTAIQQFECQRSDAGTQIQEPSPQDARLSQAVPQ